MLPTPLVCPPISAALQSRRREQERLERLDEEWDVMKASVDFQRKQEALLMADEERTARKRAQRQKKKVLQAGMPAFLLSMRWSLAPVCLQGCCCTLHCLRRLHDAWACMLPC